MSLLETFKDKKIIHISDIDLDGISSRILAEYYLRPITAKYSPILTDNRISIETEIDNKLLDSSDTIIFTDLTPSSYDNWKNLVDKNKEIYIFDHHKSARELLGELPNYYFDLDKCGTKIFYNALLNGKRRKPVIKQFVELVNIYDLWKQDSPDWQKAKALHNTCYGYVDWSHYKTTPKTVMFDNFIKAQLVKFQKDSRFIFTYKEQLIIQRALQKEESAYKQAKRSLKIRTDTKGNQYAYIECTSKLSLVASRILKELQNKIEYLIGYTTYNPNNTKVSVRSHNNFDVAKICTEWGGGGHFNSAGIDFKDKIKVNDLRQGKFHLI